MSRHLTALAAAIALAAAVPASAIAAQNPFQARHLGDMTCGGWRSAPEGYTSIQKSALLNWVLGFLSGRTAVRGDDILATVEVSSVAAWFDDYCSRNPLNYLATGAFELEKELIARRRG